MDTSHPVTKKEIVSGLYKLGICAGDILLVHTALSHFGYVEGGADTVIDALLEAVSPGGTIMVPTLTGRADYSWENPPIFDPVNTPCWTGRVPETFRHRPEALRSFHPTHSVAAIGPDAEELIRDHEMCYTPCGVNSPYGKLVRFGGKVVLLGVNHENSTLFHHIEELADLKYHIQEKSAVATILLPDGTKKKVTIGLHFYASGRDFNIMEPVLLSHNVQRMGPIGDAAVRVVSARGMVTSVMDVLDKDRWAFFVDKKAAREMFPQV